jgi:HPt (histidine-containing phosphotransfer) domain-containing protein
MFPYPERAPISGDPTQQTLVLLWERGLPRLQQRLSEIDRAASAAVAGTLPQDVRQHAASTAHMLAGSLGMFGYTDGTAMAREIEILLEAPGELDATALQAAALALRQTLKL